ncbi:tRNA-splicing endonuclease subunit Sen34 isoform X2 [Ambystoma mexicanum]|uniref:tRNA-splicing endonuclease subunit Sen34 isoform X2 n=1 Tax=Ambystoma mexicanum TaxID=8296 RepID=UPI0037E957C9
MACAEIDTSCTEPGSMETLDQSAETGPEDLQQVKTMIRLSVLDGKVFVWNAEDARAIRECHGLAGNLVGSLARKPRQNVRLGLPLQLLPEEARLLAETGVATLVSSIPTEQTDFEESTEEETESEDAGDSDSTEDEGTPRPELEAYMVHLEESYQEQRNLALHERRCLLESLSERITRGRAKRKQERSEESAEGPLGSPPQGHLEELENLEKTFNFPRQAMMVQLPTARWPLDQELEVDWHQPSQNWPYAGQKGHEVRYLVFKDLWEMGYFLTSGSKFGGDFLVYPGDPMRFHAHFIALCFAQEDQIPLSDIITAGRLGTNVKKTVLLCSVNEEGKVSYTSLQWTGFQ